MDHIIILAAITLYLGIGVMYIHHLCRYWLALHSATHKRPATFIAAVVFWLAIFIVFITWRAFEPLTKSRRCDFQENELDDYNK